VKGLDQRLTTNCKVKFGETDIHLTEPQKENSLKIDLLIEHLLASFNVSHIPSLNPEERNRLCSYVIEYCTYNSNSNEELTATVYHTDLFETFEAFYRENLKDSRENKIPKRKELLDILVRSRSNAFQELRGLTQNL